MFTFLKYYKCNIFIIKTYNSALMWEVQPLQRMIWCLWKILSIHIRPTTMFIFWKISHSFKTISNLIIKCSKYFHYTLLEMNLFTQMVLQFANFINWDHWTTRGWSWEIFWFQKRIKMANFCQLKWDSRLGINMADSTSAMDKSIQIMNFMA